MTTPLTEPERDGIVLAVRSSFVKLTNLYAEFRPLCVKFGFAPPTTGVFARQLSELIEGAIVQHCPSFRCNPPHDLQRGGETWEVKTSGTASGITINQSYRVGGEHYVAVNYNRVSLKVRRVWVLWAATDDLFSPRVSNSNARRLLWQRALDGGRIDLLADISKAQPATVRRPRQADLWSQAG